MKILREIVLFGVSGAFGFLVDTAVLYMLKGPIGPFYGRIFSFLAAVLTTWLLNRYFTFRERKSGLSTRREFVAYLLLMLIGGGVNYGVYAWLIVSSPFASQYPVVGVAAGSLAGMFVNLVNSRYLLYRFC
ncbi:MULTISPECIES: GtrA family protein [Azotobacter]|uniref:GtrA family protein n=1 Tax=Azotobacter TaxID=352 RepID=UPI0000526FDF|nr:GtrA family protein [Azotobacter vinelandii]SFX86761.1 Putative flippase GtrA (transmembrane translocase of bactoprenol-linked glucose) [Azotobacter vinelandii]